MKKLKIYFGLTLITLFTSIIFFACSNENLETNNDGNLETNTTISNRTGTISCYISGTTVTNANTNNAISTVNAGSTTTYVYNSSPIVNNIQWSIVTANPAGSITITNSNSGTITVTFASNFISGSIKCVGTDSSGQTCGPVLPITKSAGSGTDCSCTPVFANEFYNVPVSGGGNVENTIYFGKRTTCTFDWSTVSSVKIQIGGVFGVGSNSLSVPNINTMGQTGGMANNSNWTTTPSGFRNIKIRTHLNSSNIDPGFLRNNTLGSQPGWATIKFNNGCPDKILYLNDDPEFSFIN